MPGSPSKIQVFEHPLLKVAALWARWPQGTGGERPPWLAALTDPRADSGLRPPDLRVRAAVRGLLRHGGFSPSGRNKPCSEWIFGAAEQGAFPEISPAVDACNAACLHGGLPISTVDADLLQGPLHIAVAGEGESYLFNRSGQELRLTGLLCLYDSLGPCANGVKDAQRTKTSAETRHTLSVIWGTRDLPGRTDEIAAWYRAAMERLGAEVTVGALEELPRG